MILSSLLIGEFRSQAFLPSHADEKCQGQVDPVPQGGVDQDPPLPGLIGEFLDHQAVAGW